MYPLVVGDFVEDHRIKQVFPDPADAPHECYDGSVLGEVVEVSDTGFRVQWPRRGDVRPLQMGYSWGWLERGLVKH